METSVGGCVFRKNGLAIVKETSLHVCLRLYGYLILCDFPMFYDEEGT